MSQPSLQSRIETSFLCLAITDALGAPLEFQPRRRDPSSYVTTLLANRNFGLPAGHFTDDTSMALCLASSLLESKGKTDRLSQARAYVSWFREGWMSSVPGECFDIGNQTHPTLRVGESAIRKVDAGSADAKAQADATQAQIFEFFARDHQCGNGSLMRVLPSILVASSEEQAVQLARDSSDLTHPNPRCADACGIYAILVYRALRGAGKEELFQALRDFMHGPESEKVDSELRTRFKSYDSIDAFEQKPESQISSSGYVLHTLEAVLWTFFTTESYRDGAIKVVNLGNDADTVGAIYGGLAGAFYGHKDVIPKDWVDGMQSLEIVNGVVADILRAFHPVGAFSGGSPPVDGK